MMRLSCLTLSYGKQFNSGQMDIFRFLDTCRALNLDGVDLHVRNLGGTERSHLKEIRRKCLDRGLTISSACVTTEFGRSAEAIPGEIEKAREAMEVGMFLGAPLLRVFVGSAPSEAQREEAFRRGVDALRRTAEIGAGLGMPVALQNHSGLTSTGDDMLRFYREVHHPNFTLLLDTGHFAGRDGPNGPRIAGLTYADYYHSIEQVAPLTQFVRAKLYDLDANGREKWIDYRRVFNILHGVHYNGFISLVYEGQEDAMAAIPRGARFLRSFLL
ncbi:MAG TPA: sugar phosphate isomerase/epimerase family protein [Bryobacteraceae bacterium]|nr:sugar phosphate isomerase/epimerase family protein [Bryobacteraceae bacterium]